MLLGCSMTSVSEQGIRNNTQKITSRCQKPVGEVGQLATVLGFKQVSKHLGGGKRGRGQADRGATTRKVLRGVQRFSEAFRDFWNMMGLGGLPILFWGL